MEEGFPPEHGGELLGDSLEELLDGGGVANEGGGHLEASGRDIADSRLDIVGNPLHEVGRVLVLDVEHLFVHLLHGHATTEDGGHRQIPAHHNRSTMLPRQIYSRANPRLTLVPGQKMPLQIFEIAVEIYERNPLLSCKRLR